ncbi:MAG: acylphosphatase [Betaproteobacteria bacterium]|jgi:acylphosphatase|nr:acylphosphatase [Betaproteobacteria bacterium]
MVTRQIRVSGRVQGVGYRVSLQHEARRQGVSGWVRNRRDGTVEAVLQGSAEAVDAVIAWARQGPQGSRVTDVIDSAAEQEPAHAQFVLRPTS